MAKLIPNLSQTASPSEPYSRKTLNGTGLDSRQRSFDSLEKLTTEAPVLKYFDATKPVKISVHSSSKGMGAILLQDEHPVTYASKALTSSQQNYAQLEKEMFAIVFDCTTFHEYIFGLTWMWKPTRNPLKLL